MRSLSLFLCACMLAYMHRHAHHSHIFKWFGPEQHKSPSINQSTEVQAASTAHPSACRCTALLPGSLQQCSPGPQSTAGSGEHKQLIGERIRREGVVGDIRRNGDEKSGGGTTPFPCLQPDTLRATAQHACPACLCVTHRCHCISAKSNHVFAAATRATRNQNRH